MEIRLIIVNIGQPGQKWFTFLWRHTRILKYVQRFVDQSVILQHAAMFSVYFESCLAPSLYRIQDFLFIKTDKIPPHYKKSSTGHPPKIFTALCFGLVIFSIRSHNSEHENWVENHKSTRENLRVKSSSIDWLFYYIADLSFPISIQFQNEGHIHLPPSYFR